VFNALTSRAVCHVKESQAIWKKMQNISFCIAVFGMVGAVANSVRLCHAIARQQCMTLVSSIGGIELASTQGISPRNKILAALPEADHARLRPHLRAVSLALGEVLYEPGAVLAHLYFPIDSIVSLLYVMENGASAEIAIVGNDGVVGVSLFMGGITTPSRAVVQSAGTALRLPGHLLKEEFLRAGPMQQLLLRYTQALLTQMAQTAVCNRHHSLDQQLCRWLLLSLDRLPSNEVVMTQELIANMLGVRREGVTEAAGNLQDAGLIRYSRGRIEVLDRAQLEARACECYAVVKRESDRLLPFAEL
jgi:CRP-like cAMP-binding protein